MPQPPEPRGLLIERAILARLETIKRADGFFTDAGDNADIGPVHKPNVDVSVAVQFDNETPQQSGGKDTGNPQVSDRYVLLKGFKIVGQIRWADEETPRGEQMHKLLSDIKRAVFNGVPWDTAAPKTLGWPTYTGATLSDARKDGNEYESVTATGTTTYTEAIGVPSNAD